MSDSYGIGSSRVSATITAKGAELVSLKDAEGNELLWQAGPEWPRHAPVLFPIVGKLAGDALRHDGAVYRMTQHGFARDATFSWVERGASRAVLSLSDSPATHAIYPFPFRLTLAYAAEDAVLSVTATVANPGDAPLPFCLGAHPGFRWPLVDGVAKSDHVLVLAAEETGPRLMIEGGLLGAEEPAPIEGRVMRLSEELFAADAVVLPAARSTSARYAALGSDGEELRALTVSWDGYEDLGVWSKPGGAPFLCIEPWRGMASPVGWDGDFVDKPGVVLLAPGEERAFTWRVEV
ncbi:aldose 1-epimerase family protein [Methylopila sp. Yamaguchi]|uniref:aldose 1-epimerase family protein n=1 Tax=Methylopila sp. Yamaguchi TaxID=1437817 RepID=UPI000CBFCDBA|nr:aldose 1-epimerase family protein [Methylopila sp. Yamaguchi]GBD50897.1 aldose 1-epimerase [Methylopila sp. Yamaguchi]